MFWGRSSLENGSLLEVVDVYDFFYIHAHLPYGLHKNGYPLGLLLVLWSKTFLSQMDESSQCLPHVISAFPSYHGYLW